MYRKIVKPILDFILSLFLIIVCSPLMLLVAIITFFNLGLPLHNLLREREGKNRKPYIMFKFRTKVLDPDGTTNSNTFTNVSRFIDRTRLNELPQLFNVLLGQMSLVGPRPFIPGESEQFKDILDEKRYLLKPGITGLAQVSGGRSITTKAKLQYDVEYYDNLNLWLDVKILFKTLIQVLKFNIDESIE